MPNGGLCGLPTKSSVVNIPWTSPYHAPYTTCMANIESLSLVVMPILSSDQLSDEIAEQIVASSRQEHIHKATKDDIERFSSVDAVRLRFNTEQLLLPLIHKPSNQLAGLAWFRPKHSAEAPWAELTYAHRLYKGYLNIRLSKPFAHGAHQAAFEHYGQKDVWLKTELNNTRAVATYEAIGYRAIAQASGVVTMAIDLADFSQNEQEL